MSLSKAQGKQVSTQQLSFYLFISGSSFILIIASKLELFTVGSQGLSLLLLLLVFPSYNKCIDRLRAQCPKAHRTQSDINILLRTCTKNDVHKIHCCRELLYVISLPLSFSTIIYFSFSRPLSHLSQIIFNFGQRHRKSLRYCWYWATFDSHRMERRLVSTNETFSTTRSRLWINKFTLLQRQTNTCVMNKHTKSTYEQTTTKIT